MKKIILKESKLTLLSESFSQVLYHYTDEDGLYDICKNNAIQLTPANKYYTNYTINDKNINGDYPYYLSFTRQRNSNMGYASWKFQSSLATIRITFDGDKLQYNYKGEPVDYFKRKSKSNIFRNPNDAAFVQSEDRLFSNQPVIKNADKYITKIEILLNNNEEEDIQWLKEFINELKQTKLGNKIITYTNVKEFNK